MSQPSPAHRRGFTFLEVLAVGTTLFGIVLASGWYVRRDTGRAVACQQNLLLIHSAKLQFLEDRGKIAGDPVTQFDLDAGGNGTGYLKTIPVEPYGYTYEINNIATDPDCTSGEQDHSLAAAIAAGVEAAQ